MSDQFDFSGLVRNINQRLAARQTGTLFLKADDGHAYAIACRNGSIIGVWSGASVGNAAMEKLFSIKTATCRFNPTAFAPLGSEPEPSYISRLLEREDKTRFHGEDEPMSDRQGPEFHQQALEVIKANLFDLLGPIARIILDDALCSVPHEYISTSNLQDVLSILAAEIDDDDQAKRFVQHTTSALNTKLAN